MFRPEFHNGSYKGEMKNCKRHGKGIFTYNDGNRYEGEYIDDKKHGKGVFYYSSGDRYEGEYRNNKKNVMGVFYYHSGNRYEGEFLDDKRHGKGVYYFSNGDRYDGDIRDDKMTGSGTYYYSNGNRHVGEFLNGESNGNGVFYYPNGDRFEGLFRDDKRNGKGIQYYHNGDRFEGEFRDNKMHGRGYYEKGEKRFGKIHYNGEIISKTEIPRELGEIGRFAFLVGHNLENLANGEELNKSFKEYVLDEVRNNGESLQFASEELKGDKEVVLESVRHNVKALQYASEELKSDREIVIEAFSKGDYEVLEFASEDVQNDKTIVSKVVILSQGEILKSNILKKWKFDKELILHTLRNDGKIILYAADKLQRDKKFVIESVRVNGFSLQFALPSFKDDEEVVREAVIRHGGFFLGFASERLKNEKEFVLNVIKGDDEGQGKRFSLEIVGETLKNDSEVVLESVKKRVGDLKFASDELRSSKMFILETVKENGLSLEFANDALKKDEDIVFEAIRQNRESIEFASSELLKERKFILESVKIIGGYALMKTDENFRNEKVFILKVVEEDGMVLEYAGDELKNDKDVVLTAVKNNGMAIKYASFEMKKDYDVAKETIIGESNGSRLEESIDLRQWIPENLWREIVLSNERLMKSAVLGYTKKIDENKSKCFGTKLIGTERNRLFSNLSKYFLERSLLHHRLKSWSECLRDLVLHYQLSNMDRESDRSSPYHFQRMDVMSNAMKSFTLNIVSEKLTSENRYPLDLLDRSFYSSFLKEWCDEVPWIEEKHEELTKRIREKTLKALKRKIFHLVSQDYREGRHDAKLIGLVKKITFEKFDEVAHYIIFEMGEASKLIEGRLDSVSYFREFKPKKVKYKYIGFVNSKGEPHGCGAECRKFRKKKNFTFFKGSYQNGKREGKGIEYDFPKKYDHPIHVFEGVFSCGVRHGRGELFDPKTGVAVMGKWKFGELDESTTERFNFPVISCNSEIIGEIEVSSKVLGEGAFGKVYQVKTDLFPELEHVKEEYVAVKIVEARSRLERNILCAGMRRGIRLVYKLNSKYVLEIYGMINIDLKIGCIMKLCGDSIYKLICRSERKEKNYILPTSQRLKILQETAMGMRSLHERNVMHRDLKWPNVLLGYDNVVKITDFDTVKEDLSDWKLNSIVQCSAKQGTSGFFAPEVHLGEKIGLKCDVFAFGLMIYSLLFGVSNPYLTQFRCSCGCDINEMYERGLLDKHIAECNFRPLLDPQTVSKHPEFLINLMIRCWDRNIFNRPSFKEICDSFEMEGKKAFSTITLQFPKYEGMLKNQKMFLSKPFEISKVKDWIEKKFRVVDEMKGEDEGSSFLSHVDSSSREKKSKNKKDEEREEETEGEEGGSEIFVSSTNVVSLSHHVVGEIETDEDLVKLMEREGNPTMDVELSYIPESILDGMKGSKDQELRRLREEIRRLKVELECWKNECETERGKAKFWKTNCDEGLEENKRLKRELEILKRKEN